jgi:fatty acid desaturase
VRLNLLLAVLVPLAAVALLWAASRAHSPWGMLACAVAFSYVMLTDYALLHEATHESLHPDPRWNRFFGRVLGALFPVPFTMLFVTHRGHHERNRTDAEMFDLYYASDNRFLKRVQWYGILAGLFWPFVPLGALLAAFFPRALRARVLRERADTRHLLGDLRGALLFRIRLETGAIALAFVLLFLLLDLRPEGLLLCYACFSLNWSTRQYVGHAFSKRDVVDGAWNLVHGPLMTRVLLHGEWDLNHHRHPTVPWIHLPSLGCEPESRRGYLRQYWRQWLGPQPAEEPSPRPHGPTLRP